MVELLNKLKSDSRGMTLIELLGVIVIIGILFVVIGFAINKSQDSAKVAGAQTDLRSIQTSVEYYQKLTSQLPTAEQVSQNSDFRFHTDHKPTNFDANGLDLMPGGWEYIIDDNGTSYVSFSDKKDPWERPYVMVRDGDGKKLLIASAGPDGKLQSKPLTDAGDDVVLLIYNN